MSQDISSLITQRQQFLDSLSPNRYYEVFNLQPGCGRIAAEDAYFEWIRRHHPDRYAHYQNPELSRLVNEIFVTINHFHQRILKEEITQEPSSAFRTSPAIPNPRPAPSIRISPPTPSTPPPPTHPPTPPPTPSALSPTPSAPPPTPVLTTVDPSLFQHRPSVARQSAVKSELFTHTNPPPTPASLPIPSTPIQPPPKSPEEIFKSALRSLQIQAFDKALQSFEEALAIEPENPKYLSYVAWAQFLSNPDEHLLTSKQHLAAIKNPSDAILFFLGKIALYEKNTSAARRHFEEAVKLNPDHIDANRELRLIKMRMEQEQPSGFWQRLFGRGKKK